MTVKHDRSLMDLHPRELKGLVGEIPTLPVIYQELFRKMQDPDVAVPEIAEIISLDQALAIKVLHLVNSAFYGHSKQIKTISRAVVILGFQAVRSAALAISVFDYFKDEESSTEVDIRKFWEHSIAVGAITKVLAEAHLSQLASLVHVADWMSYEMGHGAPGAYPPPHCERSALSLLGIETTQLGEHEARIREEISHSLEILKLVE